MAFRLFDDSGLTFAEGNNGGLIDGLAPGYAP